MLSSGMFSSMIRTWVLFRAKSGLMTAIDWLGANLLSGGLDGFDLVNDRVGLGDLSKGAVGETVDADDCDFSDTIDSCGPGYLMESIACAIFPVGLSTMVERFGTRAVADSLRSRCAALNRISGYASCPSAWIPCGLGVEVAEEKGESEKCSCRLSDAKLTRVSRHNTFLFQHEKQAA